MPAPSVGGAVYDDRRRMGRAWPCVGRRSGGAPTARIPDSVGCARLCRTHGVSCRGVRGRLLPGHAARRAATSSSAPSITKVGGSVFRSLRVQHRLESRHVRHMSRDIGDTCDQPVSWDPGHRPGSRRWLRQYRRSGSMRWVARISPVSRATTVTACSSTMARTRRRARAAPMLTWGRRPAQRRLMAPFPSATS